MDTSIFRKASLERLNNPERLDHLMQVTTPRGWIALLGLTTVVLAALIWGILGTTPEQVPVVGIMLREGGVFEIQSLGTGPIQKLMVKPGTKIKLGQVVGYVAQPGLELQISRTRMRLVALRAYRDGIARSLDKTTKIDLDAITQQVEQAAASIRTAESRVSYLEQRVDAEKRALDRGLITPDVYQGTVTQLAAARDQLVGAQVTLRQLSGRTLSTQTSQTQQVFTLDSQIREMESTLAATEEQYRQQHEVISPFDGTVLEELVDIGETVQPGKAVVSFELDQLPLHVYLFTPEGKRVSAGMKVQLVPAGVTPEEDGYMLGQVKVVSEAPLGTQAMNRYLRNDALVRSFLGDRGAYMVEVDALRDGSTVSGFKWTTAKGPNLKLGSGTLLSGNVLVNERRPITLVIPALKRWIGA